MNRQLSKFLGCASASFPLLLTLNLTPALAQPLDPATVPKYVTPLAVPQTMPMTGMLPGGIEYYEVAVRQFSQQVLPAGFPMTTVWGYGSLSDPGSFSSPGPTFEATVNTPLRVNWINDLVDQDGDFIPYPDNLPVDQKLHWANPPMDCEDGIARPDCRGQSDALYNGPIPIITHLHGSHVTPESDGFPEAWYLPAANDIPAGYATQGSHYGQIAGVPVEAGAAVFQYSNDQRATTLWYHDHSLGITRLNNYAGLAGFYLLRGGPADLPAGVLPAAPYEIPIVIQDRSFNQDGSLLYLDGEGDTMVVNGNTWPFFQVEQRRYRFRFLNGSNRNLVKLLMATDNTPLENGIDDGNYTELINPFVQIGADGGFLPAPVMADELLIGGAERADVIVDFSGFAAGAKIYLVNDEGEGPATTGQVMKFIVESATSADTSTPTDLLALPAINFLGPADSVRRVSLNGDALLGVVDPVTGLGAPQLWSDPLTEDPALNSTEIWEMYNFTGDKHPMHIHQVQFEIINREDIASGEVRGPEPGETGTKDTVIAHGGEITRVKAKFDLAGLYVWHCHILEHEDDEMMRPFNVSQCALTGDLNGDGAVNLLDFAIFRQNFGSAGVNLPGDFNGDGAVNLLDFGIFRANFGTACP